MSQTVNIGVDTNLSDLEVMFLEKMGVPAEKVSEYAALETLAQQVNIGAGGPIIQVGGLAVFPVNVFTTPPSTLAAHDQAYIQRYFREDVGVVAVSLRIVVKRDAIAGLNERPMLPTFDGDAEGH